MSGAAGPSAFVPIAISHKVATLHPSTCIDYLHCVFLDPLMKRILSTLGSVFGRQEYV